MEPVGEDGNDTCEEYVCINCYHTSPTLFHKYSDNGIRLTRCTNCGKVVDEYIEYDVVLIIIDLILQYIKAYRHLLMNTKNRSLHKLCIIFLLCDAYSKWIRRRIMSGTENIYDLEWKFYECLLQSLMEMISFVVVVVALLRTNTWRKVRVLQIIRIVNLHSICFGGWSIICWTGNVFVVLSIIWQLHVIWSYRALTELFIFVSHVQTQRALHNRKKVRSILAVAAATVISRSIGLLMNSYCFM